VLLPDDFIETLGRSRSASGALTPANQAMPLVILALIAFLWWYCRRMTDRKVLA
jgi:hypothetical protein